MSSPLHWSHCSLSRYVAFGRHSCECKGFWMKGSGWVKEGGVGVRNFGKVFLFRKCNLHDPGVWYCSSSAGIMIGGVQSQQTQTGHQQFYFTQYRVPPFVVFITGRRCKSSSSSPCNITTSCSIYRAYVNNNFLSNSWDWPSTFNWRYNVILQVVLYRYESLYFTWR